MIRPVVKIVSNPRGLTGPAGEVTSTGSSVTGNLASFSDTTGDVIQDSGVAKSIDGTLASNVDTKLPTEKAVKTYIDTGLALKIPTSYLDTDGALAANSDVKIATQKAVVTYVAANSGGGLNNLTKNGNFINNSTNGYGSTPDDWTSSSANPVQGGIPALTKQNLIDLLGVVDGDIEGLWPLNETSGNAVDLSSNAYNLTDTAAVGSSLDGLMAKARDYESGSTQYHTIADASCPNLEIAGSQTWFGFIKPESVSTNVILGKGKNTVGAFHQINIDSSSKASFLLSGLSTTPNIVSDVILQVGKWYMIVGVYDSANSKIKIWVNGIKKEATATGTATDTNSSFAIGCNFNGGGDTASSFYDGLLQNACVLSVALTDNQVNRLFAATLYKGQKIRRATTNASMTQSLPQDLVERLRGRAVAMTAKVYQEVASTAQVSINDGSETSSTTSATTGSYINIGVLKTISATATSITLSIKHSTSDGNSWFKEVLFYEGTTLLYTWYPSYDDTTRFPRLLQLDIPAVISGYQFEEGRWMAHSALVTVSGGTAPTYTSSFLNRFLIRKKTCRYDAYWYNVVGGTAGAGGSAIVVNLPSIIGSSNSSANGIKSIGFGHSFESAGTQVFFSVTDNTTNNSVNFTTSGFGSSTGNDQSSTQRMISFIAEWEID